MTSGIVSLSFKEGGDKKVGYAPQERNEVQQEGCLDPIEAGQVHLSQTVQHGVQVRTAHPAHLTLTSELTAGGHLAAAHGQ